MWPGLNEPPLKFFHVIAAAAAESRITPSALEAVEHADRLANRISVPGRL